MGLFGYGEQKSIVKPAEEVSPELEQAMRESLIMERLPCADAWAIATRFGMPKLHVANAVEKVKSAAGFVTEKAGGHGAIREAIEHLLRTSRRWDQVLAYYGGAAAART